MSLVALVPCADGFALVGDSKQTIERHGQPPIIAAGEPKLRAWGPFGVAVVGAVWQRRPGEDFDAFAFVGRYWERHERHLTDEAVKAFALALGAYVGACSPSRGDSAAPALQNHDLVVLLADADSNQCAVLALAFSAPSLIGFRSCTVNPDEPPNVFPVGRIFDHLPLLDRLLDRLPKVPACHYANASAAAFAEHLITAVAAEDQYVGGPLTTLLLRRETPDKESTSR